MSAPKCQRCGGAGIVTLYDEADRPEGQAMCGRCDGTGVAQ